MIKYKKQKEYSEEELETLFKSPNYKDRIIAVQNNYKLNELVKDKSFWVREEVARQGYGLDILSNDSDEDVRETVKEYLKKHLVRKKEIRLRNRLINII